MLNLRIKFNSKTIAATAAIVLIGWMGTVLLRSPLEKEAGVIITDGAGVYEIANILKEKGVIDNKFIFVVFALVTGNEKNLKAGKYIFKPGTTVPTVVYSMVKGLTESDDVGVTIPEGSNVWEIDRILTRATLIEEGEFAKEVIGLGGRLFPDTYRFKKYADIENVINKMTDNFRGRTFGLLRSDINSFNDTLIIASILEKETKTEEDMRLVAGVIRNRLERGILLQVDATVAYGACLRNFEMSIYRNIEYKYCDVSQVAVGEEIKIDGPYNTYTRAGLPPGPISNPGLKAILAALNPAETDYLYYLSTRDGGQVIFSKTAAEHVTNRRKYLGI